MKEGDHSHNKGVLELFVGSDGMLPDGLWAKTSTFLSNNPAVQELHAWMLSQPMLAQVVEWVSVLNQHRWGVVVIIMVVGLVLRFISPFLLIFRLLWATAIRLLIAIVIHAVVVPVNRFSAWLGRPRSQHHIRQAPPPPGSNDPRQ